MAAPLPKPPVKKDAKPVRGKKRRPNQFAAGSRVASLDGRSLGRISHRQRYGLCTVEWENGEVTVTHEANLISRYTRQSTGSGRRI